MTSTRAQASQAILPFNSDDKAAIKRAANAERMRKARAAAKQAEIDADAIAAKHAAQASEIERRRVAALGLSVQRLRRRTRRGPPFRRVGMSWWRRPPDPVRR